MHISQLGQKSLAGQIRFNGGEITWIELELSNKEIMLNPNTQKLEYKLESGIYAKDDKLLISWNELIEKELIYETEDGYIIYDRFMNEWLRSLPF